MSWEVVCRLSGDPLDLIQYAKTREGLRVVVGVDCVSVSGRVGRLRAGSVPRARAVPGEKKEKVLSSRTRFKNLLERSPWSLPCKSFQYVESRKHADAGLKSW